MTTEVENLNREQRTLQAKIDEFERELEGERVRKRTLEREINELTLQVNHKRLAGVGSSETSRMQFLKEEINKKQIQISAAQREYKTLLEQRTDSILNPLQGSPPPRSAAADASNLQKLEQEMRAVKEMLSNMNANKIDDGADLSRADEFD